MRDNPYKDLPPLERRPDGSQAVSSGISAMVPSGSLELQDGFRKEFMG